MQPKALRLLSRGAFFCLIILILLYTLFPFYWAFISSIKPVEELFTPPLNWWPKSPTLEHYKALFNPSTTVDFPQAILNSTIVSVSVVALSLVFGAVAAYALGRIRFRGRTPVLYIVLAMTMFPQIAVLGGLFNLIQTIKINDTNLYNKLPALIITYLLFTLPFTVWVLTNFFRAMPGELEEAAYVDGATPLQVFWKVLLPLAMPGLVTTGLLAFIQAWNEYLFALSFTQTPDKHTVPLSITNFSGTGGSSFEVPWGQISAASVLVTIPIIILTLVFQRRILAGLTAGAVKG